MDSRGVGRELDTWIAGCRQGVRHVDSRGVGRESDTWIAGVEAEGVGHVDSMQGCRRQEVRERVSNMMRCIKEI